MKKVVTTLAICITLCTAKSYAQTKVPSTIETAFQTSFKNATEQTWQKVSNLYRTDFSFDGRQMSAFFEIDGKLVATGRQLSVSELPIDLQVQLKNSYSNGIVRNSFEVDMNDEASYYVTVDTATKRLTLKSTSWGEWEVYDKESFRLL